MECTVLDSPRSAERSDGLGRQLWNNVDTALPKGQFLREEYSIILPKGEIYLPCHACTKVQRMTGLCSSCAGFVGTRIRANTLSFGQRIKPGFGRQADWEDYAMLALELGT
jgi:hypothetical protein